MIFHSEVCQDFVFGLVRGLAERLGRVQRNCAMKSELFSLSSIG